MALARRRCYSIERLLRGLRQILPPFPSCSLSSSVSSSSSSSTFSHPPPLVGVAAASHTRARKGREGKRREEKRESVPLFLPVTPPAFRLRPFPPKPSRDPTTSSPLRGPRVETPSSFSLTAARGGGGSGPSLPLPPPPPPPPRLSSVQERRGERRDPRPASLYPLSLISRRHRRPDPTGGGLTLIGSEATSRRLRGTDRRTLSKNRTVELDGRLPTFQGESSSRPPPGWGIQEEEGWGRV